MDKQDSTVEPGRGPLVSRRTIAIGAAWTVPVIITAVAAPTASASPIPNLAALWSAVHTKGSTYTLTVTFPSGTSTEVQVLSVIPEDPKKNASTFTSSPKGPLLAAPSADFSVVRKGDNSSLSVVVTYTLDGGAPQTASVIIPTD